MFVDSVKCSGKTTLVNYLSFTIQEEVQPTMEADFKSFTLGNTKFGVYDLVGNEENSSLKWIDYYSRVDLLMYVVDGSQSESEIRASADKLDSFLRTAKNRKPILVIFNKNDLAWELDFQSVFNIFKDKLAKYDELDYCASSISAKQQKNVEAVIDWMLSTGNKVKASR